MEHACADQHIKLTFGRAENEYPIYRRKTKPALKENLKQYQPLKSMNHTKLEPLLKTFKQPLRLLTLNKYPFDVPAFVPTLTSFNECVACTKRVIERTIPDEQDKIVFNQELGQIIRTVLSLPGNNSYAPAYRTACRLYPAASYSAVLAYARSLTIQSFRNGTNIDELKKVRKRNV
uniref:Ras-GEF domain-containing protein n=1 Tax=Strongyloides venezuelensis TaxID=75913 RepID=A0A0K0FTH9_STRVS